jgi:hypothetical protein
MRRGRLPPLVRSPPRLCRWHSDSREHRDYYRYEIYFDGSVAV